MSRHKVKTVDGEAFPCNRQDAKSILSDAFQQNMKIVVIRLEAQCPVRTPLPRNPFLTCFRISEAYLNGLLGIVSLRIP
jgi:hypothetical protein